MLRTFEILTGRLFFCIESKHFSRGIIKKCSSLKLGWCFFFWQAQHIIFRLSYTACKLLQSQQLRGAFFEGAVITWFDHLTEVLHLMWCRTSEQNWFKQGNNFRSLWRLMPHILSPPMCKTRSTESPLFRPNNSILERPPYLNLNADIDELTENTDLD